MVRSLGDRLKGLPLVCLVLFYWNINENEMFWHIEKLMGHILKCSLSVLTFTLKFNEARLVT